jgi:hypothetical protein
MHFLFLREASFSLSLLQGVSFCCADASSLDTYADGFRHSHIYCFDRVFSPITLEALAKVLMRSPFYIFISSKAPRVWWRHGLTKVQPVAKVRFTTTGRERMTLFVFVNSHFIPGLG